MKDYKEEEYLQLSGIQHFAFCRRQWALIHIENQWKDNYRTIDGIDLHKKAHDSSASERRGNVLIKRAIRVFSPSLGISGECDVVEFHRNENGISLPNEVGHWEVVPIEYKRGEVKNSNIDELQLCAEAMCLEEMLCCEISYGYLYYGKTRKRTYVGFDENLRNSVKESFEEMHELYSKKYTPKVKQKKSCLNCSLNDICLPKISKIKSVSKYIEETIEYEKNT